MRRGRQRARRAPCDVRGQDGGQHCDDNKDEGSAALSSDEMVDTNNEDLASLTLNTNIEKCIYPGSSNPRAILFRVKSRQNNEEKDCFTMLGACH